MDYTILDILKRDPDMAPLLVKYKEDIKNILDSVVNQELSWATYLFSEGRAVLGLNEKLLQQYTLHMSEPLYNALGIPFNYTQVKENPLKYVEKYIDSSKMQSAAQEIQITSYKKGAIKDDTAGLDLDLDF